MTEMVPSPASELPELELLGSLTERRTETAVRRLFDGEGTVYLVTAFFTANAFRMLRADIESFLNRSPSNELVLVVGSGADQFSTAIARELWGLETAGSVRLYRYPHGFLHAKLYLRAGPDPVVILGSANLTKVAFEQNLEVGTIIRGDTVDHPSVQPFLEWVEGLLSVCEPLRRRDLFTPVRLLTTFRNWSKKGQLLPVRRAARRAALPFAVLVTAVLWRLLDVGEG